MYFIVYLVGCCMFFNRLLHQHPPLFFVGGLYCKLRSMNKKFDDTSSTAVESCNDGRKVLHSPLSLQISDSPDNLSLIAAADASMAGNFASM